MHTRTRPKQIFLPRRILFYSVLPSLCFQDQDHFLDGTHMETTKGDDMMVLNVKFGKDNHTLELPVDSKVDRVYEALETLTGVFQRCQKVIFKGESRNYSASWRVSQDVFCFTKYVISKSIRMHPILLRLFRVHIMFCVVVVKCWIRKHCKDFSRPPVWLASSVIDANVNACE